MRLMYLYTCNSVVLLLTFYNGRYVVIIQCGYRSVSINVVVMF